MRRRHLVEIAELAWCPRIVRDGLTNYLQAAIRLGRPYAPATSLLVEALRAANQFAVVDLASGAGGPWAELGPALVDARPGLTVRLTDRYPNTDAFDRIALDTHDAVLGDRRPVDATCLPTDLVGFRTMFSAFHHFAPPEARAILADAVRARRGIAVFEATRRDRKALLLMLLAPLLVLVLSLRLRPVHPGRLLLTYVIPVIPLVVAFDGIVSCLRTYSVDDLRTMTAGLGGDDWEWRIGEVGDGPIPMTYAIGVPARPA